MQCPLFKFTFLCCKVIKSFRHNATPSVFHTISIKLTFANSNNVGSNSFYGALGHPCWLTWAHKHPTDTFCFVKDLPQIHFSRIQHPCRLFVSPRLVIYNDIFTIKLNALINKTTTAYQWLKHKTK